MMACLNTNLLEEEQTASYHNTYSSLDTPGNPNLWVFRLFSPVEVNHNWRGSTTILILKHPLMA